MPALRGLAWEASRENTTERVPSTARSSSKVAEGGRLLISTAASIAVVPALCASIAVPQLASSRSGVLHLMTHGCSKLLREVCVQTRGSKRNNWMQTSRRPFPNGRRAAVPPPVPPLVAARIAVCCRTCVGYSAIPNTFVFDANALPCSFTRLGVGTRKIGGRLDSLLQNGYKAALEESYSVASVVDAACCSKRQQHTLQPKLCVAACRRHMCAALQLSPFPQISTQKALNWKNVVI